MGYEVGEWTVQVLENGLPRLPDHLEPGETVPVAFWRGQRFGAVLHMRLWRNGRWDSDCAVTERDAEGGWEHPSSWAGGGWVNPFERPDDGWDGEPVLWIGRRLLGFDDDADDESPRADHLEYMAGETNLELRGSFRRPCRLENLLSEEDFPIRVQEGMAARVVAAIEVQQGDRKTVYAIDSPTGAFVVGVESPGAAVLRPLGHDKQLLADSEGRPVEAIL
ncbi:MAG TPA: hypothetical protein VK988_03925 [Acidimicrobiales bacterium]|nr:hypothetical protein [Acidimicrobiales bacterium]